MLPIHEVFLFLFLLFLLIIVIATVHTLIIVTSNSTLYHILYKVFVHYTLYTRYTVSFSFLKGLIYVLSLHFIPVSLSMILCKDSTHYEY